MESFQRDLLHDLGERAQVLRSRVGEAANDPDRSGVARLAQAILQTVGRDINHLEHDPRLADPRFDQQHRMLLEHLTTAVTTVESVLVPAVERFNQTDRRLTRLTARLVEQINWPLAAPMVSASTEAGYATYATFGLIKVPAAEDTSMLALPDLVHELTHILLVTERPRLVGDFVKVLADYFTEQQNQPDRAPLSPMLFEHWRGPWLQEFVSDMVAAYVCGPVFADQHIRLIAGMPSVAFRGMTTHPPDEARARGAAAVMRAMGHTSEASDISSMVSRYLSTTSEARGPEYDRVMPDELLDALAQRVIRGCDQLGIRRFDAPEVSRPDDVVGMIQEGWRRFHTNAQTFPRWQRARLEMLWRDLGVDGAAGAPRTQRPRPAPRTTRGGTHELAA